MNKKCPKCGKTLPYAVIYCPNCGADTADQVTANNRRHFDGAVWFFAVISMMLGTINIFSLHIPWLGRIMGLLAALLYWYSPKVTRLVNGAMDDMNARSAARRRKKNNRSNDYECPRCGGHHIQVLGQYKVGKTAAGLDIRKTDMLCLTCALLFTK